MHGDSFSRLDCFPTLDEDNYRGNAGKDDELDNRDNGIGLHHLEEIIRRTISFSFTGSDFTTDKSDDREEKSDHNPDVAHSTAERHAVSSSF